MSEACFPSATIRPALPSDRRKAAPARPVVVFDLDGTLVDSAPDLGASLDHCLAAVGLPPVPLDLVRPHAGHGAKVMLRTAYAWEGRPLPEDELAEQIARFLAFYEAHIADRSAPFPGAVAAMDRLEDAGFALAVCTNKFEYLASRLLGELGIAGRFAAICGADTFSRRKPDPIHLAGTVKRAGGGAALMIGDTITDIDTALAANVPSVLVDFGYAPDAEARAKAGRIIESFSELDAKLAFALLGAHL